MLKPLELADADQTQRLFPHWEIVRYLSHVVPWPYPADGAYRFYQDVALPTMQRGEQWHWTLRLKTAPENLIGSISLLRGENQNRGFWLGLPWHGQGLMSEATEVVTDYQTPSNSRKNIRLSPSGNSRGVRECDALSHPVSVFAV